MLIVFGFLQIVFFTSQLVSFISRPDSRQIAFKNRTLPPCTFYGSGETKFPDKVQADQCLARLVRNFVLLQISVNVRLNMSERENGQLPLAKRTIRNRISSERWEQIKVAYISGIGLREIARKTNIPEGTVLAHAKRYDWTQQIQVATQQQSDAITPVQSVPQSLVAILSERKEMSKCHSNLIRTVTCARRAYFVDKGGMAAAIGVIRVETIVRDGQEQHAVTIDVNAA
jgi:hypothetical protein